MAHAGFPQRLGTTVEEVAAQLKADASSHRLLLLEDGCPVGEAVWRLAEEKGAAEIGIKLCVPSARGRGLGTQYLHRLLRYLFGPGGFALITLTGRGKPARKACVRETGVCANGGISSDVADAAGMQSAGIPVRKKHKAPLYGDRCSNACPFSYPANKCQKEGGFHGCIYEAAKTLFAAGGAALAALGVAAAVTEIRLRCQQPVTLQTMLGHRVISRKRPCENVPTHQIP